ncbi:MAG TPA: preprotein translocase subunit SecE [Candidatus Saccharimonadales bacterium]|nr:preprotein translocase subunit SecE [Candidatus Saccharimonadales bacterium]
MSEESTKKKRRIRQAPETVRQKAEKSTNKPEKPKRVRKAAKKATSPLVWVAHMIGKLLRPFRFLLWPFKTRPLRFIGRILAKILLIQYFKNSWKELKQVTWPDRKQTTQLTIAVFAFAIVFGIFITLVDYGLDKVFKRILLK